MARQFDVVANPDRDDAGHRPYLIVLQSDLVSNLRSTVVAPLIARNQMLGARQLNPVVGVDGQEYWVAIYELFAIERRLLAKRSCLQQNSVMRLLPQSIFSLTGF